MAENISFTLSAQDHLTRVLQQIGAGFGQVQKSYLSLQRLVSGGAIAIGIQQIVSATVQAERASARLDAALKATGMAAGVTRAELDQMAESLKGSTAFDDDEIRKGLSALLRFRDVQGDIFRQAAQLAPDLAAALDTDVVGAYTRLGRALEDPGKGLRALREAGINVTATQEKVKRSMAETGDIAAAQKIILDDLAKSIGGAAQGENKGLYGGLTNVGKAWDDMLKAIGRSDLVMKPATASVGVLAFAFKELQAIIDAPWLDKLRHFEIGRAFLGAPSAPGAAPVDRAAQADALRGQSEAESARIIAGTQAWVDKEIERSQKENAEREKRLRAEDTIGRSAAIDAAIEAEDKMSQVLGGINDKFYEDQKKRRQEDNEGRSAAIDAAIKKEDDLSQQVARFRDQDLEKTKKVAQELGFTFASAFEDAIVNLENLRKVLESLAKDILRLFVRRNVTEPGAELLSGLFSGFLTGGSSAGDMAFASGGAFNVGGSGGTDSQRVSFLATPGERVTVTPPGQVSGGVTVVQHMTFGSDVNRSTLAEWGKQVERNTVVAVQDSMRRGQRP